MSRLVAGPMGENGGGSIIQVGTFRTHALPPGRARYTATKQAMVTASLTLAKELGPIGVRVNVVTPGFTTGPPLDALMESIAARTGDGLDDVSGRRQRCAATSILATSPTPWFSCARSTTTSRASSSRWPAGR